MIEFLIVRHGSESVARECPEELADLLQAKVSCMGDISVLTYGPDSAGVGWLLLENGLPGEPGRLLEKECPEKMGFRKLSELPGVLIGATDPRSIDALIKNLTELRDAMISPSPEISEHLGITDEDHVDHFVDWFAILDPCHILDVLDCATGWFGQLEWCGQIDESKSAELSKSCVLKVEEVRKIDAVSEEREQDAIKRLCRTCEKLLDDCYLDGSTECDSYRQNLKITRGENE